MKYFIFSSYFLLIASQALAESQSIQTFECATVHAPKIGFKIVVDKTLNQATIFEKRNEQYVVQHLITNDVLVDNNSIVVKANSYRVVDWTQEQECFVKQAPRTKIIIGLNDHESKVFLSSSYSVNPNVPNCRTIHVMPFSAVMSCRAL